MTHSRGQKAIVVLMAVGTLGAVTLTTLIAMRAERRPEPRPVASQPALRGGTHVPADALTPRVIASLPPFRLTAQTGQPVTLADLKGKAWIADFVFTRCSGPCPMMTSRMFDLQTRLREHERWADIRLVSFTVDPAHDTPEVLAEYARLAHADDQRWLFLTGTREELWGLATRGFKLPVEEQPDNVKMPILHSQKFVLIDRAGRIRGYYDGLENDDREALLKDLEKVLAETP